MPVWALLAAALLLFCCMPWNEFGPVACRQSTAARVGNCCQRCCSRRKACSMQVLWVSEPRRFLAVRLVRANWVGPSCLSSAVCDMELLCTLGLVVFA